MQYVLAFFPLFVVLATMTLARWGGHRAGLAGWAAGVAVAALGFGLTPRVFWVSQGKGLLLSLFVLAIIWTALLLYNVVDRAGGIRSITSALERSIPDRGLLLIVVAWAFSGALEGMAGFGLPIAVVSPILVGLGVRPVTAVAAVAVGHAWAVTMGDMGVIFQTLVAITGVEASALAPACSILLGVACVACGLGAAAILGQLRYWPVVLTLALAMSAIQYALAVGGLVPLSALLSGLAGVLGGLLIARMPAFRASAPSSCAGACGPADPPEAPLRLALLPYAGVILLMALAALVRPLREALLPFVWQVSFPEVKTLTGFVTPAAAGQAFRFFLHPGASLLLVATATYGGYRWLGLCRAGSGREIARTTWRAAAPASAGIVAMVGLATLMDHCGMTLLLARGLSRVMGGAYPLVSPLIGVLGAFATGSNNNSNVLLASLQKDAAVMLGLDPRVLLAAQTTGGALGSLLAPAKIVVGCSTVGLRGRDGEVLRRTLPYGIVIGLALGALAWLWTSLA